jgi:imidazolonepropionase-like amidohydrolase
MISHTWNIRLNAMITGALIAIGLPGFISASNQIPAPPQRHPIALIGGTVHTVSGETITGGIVLFENGKITAVGTAVALPDSVERIDITGKHVYPGLIGAHTSIGLTEIGSVRATRDLDELGDITPSARVVSSINPDSEMIPATRANGVLIALSAPTGGLLAGQSGLIMLDGWTWEDMTLKAPVGMHVWWPSMTIRRFPGEPEEAEQIKQRDEQITKLSEAFRAARAYHKAKTSGNAREYDSDLGWEAMTPVINRELPVLIHAQDVRQIQAALDWVASEDVRMILVGGRDAWRVADDLRKRDIPVILGGTHYLPSRSWEDYDTPFSGAAKLHRAGVRFCISDDGESSNERNLPYHAATAAAYGLPPEEALRAVTLYPAQILGVADRVGAIETGKDATLIITDGDPLEIRTRVERAYIQGRLIDLTTKHTMLYEKYGKRIREESR